jgi:hypothetical protein
MKKYQAMLVSIDQFNLVNKIVWNVDLDMAAEDPMATADFLVDTLNTFGYEGIYSSMPQERLIKTAIHLLERMCYFDEFSDSDAGVLFHILTVLMCEDRTNWIGCVQMIDGKHRITYRQCNESEFDRTYKELMLNPNQDVHNATESIQ